jgi:hypothetical protein
VIVLALMQQVEFSSKLDQHLLAMAALAFGLFSKIHLASSTMTILFSAALRVPNDATFFSRTCCWAALMPKY